MKKLLFSSLFILLSTFSFAQEIKLDKNKVDAIETLISKKLLKFDFDLDKAWISPTVWNQYNVDGKESFTVLCSLYIRYKQKDYETNASIDLFDYSTGKKIASYGFFRGFKIIS